MQTLKLWMSREEVTEEVIRAISRKDAPGSESRYYEALQDQLGIMVAEGGRRAMVMCMVVVWGLPKVVSAPGPWTVRIPMLAIWATVWKPIYFLGADIRVHLGVPKLLREMQATGHTSLSHKAAEILQKYT